MDEKIQISLDKLPVKRLESIEENGTERFPPDVDYDEKRISLIRRIDFAWAVEKDENKKKKQKKSSANESSSQTWPWQSMIDNLRSAQQELSVIVDLINTVEANDAVTVASMTRPKLLPNEVLSDLAVSAATKLQCFRGLAKYFRHSAKALERQVAREARFYGALIRLQQNWKVKRQRIAAPSSAKEGFTIDLFDNTLFDPSSSVYRSSSSLSMVRVEHDPAGMLAINLSQNSCRSLEFGFYGIQLSDDIETNKKKSSSARHSRETKKEVVSDDESIKETHSHLRQVHKAIFDEQVFDLVNREAFSPSVGVNVTGIRENYLQLSVGQSNSVFISLKSSGQDDQTVNGSENQDLENAILPLDSLDGVMLPEEKNDSFEKEGIPNRMSCEIYLQQLFHERVFSRAKDKPAPNFARVSGQPAKEGSSLLGHFCLSLAHRIFSKKVVMVLEKLVSGAPYLQLLSHPTWHSRTSSWTILMKIPESILFAGPQNKTSPDTNHRMKSASKPQFRTKVVVTDDFISVEGEGAPSIVGVFNGNSQQKVSSSMNKYECDLADLPVIILQQVAGQIIRWLHEEALMVGIKVNRDFLSLSFELEQGETLTLVAHVDPEDSQGCISWWLVMEDGFSEEGKVNEDLPNGGVSEYRKFLGHLSLDLLYSTLMDLVGLCTGASTSP